MGSPITNTSAMTALRALTATQKTLTATEKQVSTGLQVAEASDNAAYWAIGVSMKARSGMISAVNAGIDMAQNVLAVAAVGMKQSISMMNDVKKLIVAAQNGGADRVALQQQIEADTTSMFNAIGSSSFNGINLLQNNANALIFGGPVPVRAADGHVTVQTSASGDTLDLSLPVPLLGDLQSDAGVQTFGLLDVTNPENAYQGDVAANYGQGGAYPASGGTGIYSGWQADYLRIDSVSGAAAFDPNIAQTLDDVVAKDLRLVDSTLSAMTHFAAIIGGKQTQLAMQQSFNSALSDALTSGVGSLLDTDMNVASTRLQALQAQQQLGVQALSIANDNSKQILKLFG